MNAPTGTDVAKFLGEPDDTELAANADALLPTVTAFAKAHTRRKGFDRFGNPADDLAAVIVSATARYVTNPDLAGDVRLGDYSVSYPLIGGWSLAELVVLNSYRKRAT